MATRRTRVILGVAALALVAAAAAAALVVVRRAGGGASAVAAMRGLKGRLQVAQANPQRSRPKPVLRCVPARTVGAPGTLLAVDSVPASSTATALFMWPRSGNASAEMRALRALRATGVSELSGTPRALALTADGGVLREARRAAPTASAQLAVSGTKELCVAS